MIEKDILQALQQKVISAVAASTIPTLPIAFVSVAFDPPTDGKWLEIIHISNNPSDFTWGGEQQCRGIMRLVLHWPNNGAGAYTPLTLLGSIAGSFNKGTKIGGFVTLLNNPKAMPIITSDNENLYPVSIEYSVFTLA